MGLRWWKTCAGWFEYPVETRINCWVCEMDGGPYVVFYLFGWIYVWLEGCVTGLPDCGLGCGYDLAYGSVWWMALGGGFTLFVP